MKKRSSSSRTTRIVVASWSVLALLLLAVFLVALIKPLHLSGFISVGSIGNCAGYTYAHADRYTAGEAEIDDASISALDVSWPTGRLTLEVYDGNALVLRETATKSLEKEQQRVHWYVDGSVLRIRYAASGAHSIELEKNLTLQIPRTMAFRNVEIDAVSTSIQLIHLTTQKLEIDTVSSSVFAQSLDMSTLDMDCVSSRVNLILAEQCAPKEISFDSVSGDMTLRVAEQIAGFRAKMDTISGSFNSDFDYEVKKNGVYEYGDLSCKIDIDSVSVDLSIRKRDATSPESQPSSQVPAQP